MGRKEFKVNEFITLRLEKDKTNIYVNGEQIRQCKYLVFHIPIDSVQENDKIQSIDELEEKDRSGEYIELDISPEEEFWGFCSNLQAWHENEYDTRLLHSNLAYPLLQKLTEVGDPIAKKVFNEDFIHQFLEGQLRLFNDEEREELGALWNSMEHSSGGHPSDDIFLYNVQENIELAKWGVQNKAPLAFYVNLDSIKENVELGKWGIQNKAPEDFYVYFHELKENVELAKWGVQNKAPDGFYLCFNELKENNELAKWGIQNKATFRVPLLKDLFSKIKDTIISPNKVFTNPDLQDSIKYSYFISLLIACWYSIVCIILYIKAGVSTYYFLFEAVFWIIFAFLLIGIGYYLPNLLNRVLFKNEGEINKKVSANIISLSTGVPSIFIGIVDFIIVVTASNNDIRNYATGLGSTAPLSFISNYVFTAISIWLVILAIYGMKKITKLSLSKSAIITLITLLPILLLLFIFIGLESVQPF